ncbi:hypothetical protein Q1695_012578 [Nippostrongylus brasiliensis]|nr:hypothetical protein Q1695_012578 [Nippostrongylus brasiliensis]
MKVFTVGLDDKEKAQKVDVEKAEQTKATTEVPLANPMPPQIIVPRAPPAKRFGCGVLSWVVAAFFIVLLCLTISEITYNRQRDQAFLRLKWAELRQRMLGFELLSQATQQAEAQMQQQQQQQPVNELPAFSRRNDLVEDAPVTTTTTAAPETSPVKQALSSSESDSDGISPKLDFLRMLLSKMRENAEEMGMNGEMQVHVIEVKPLTNNLPQQSIDDAFGEVNMPRQPFGPWRNEENNLFNQWNAPQWGSEPRIPQDNSIFEPIWDAPQEEEPQMRITHHFDKDSQTPQRVVTELFGNAAPEVIGHVLGQKNAQAQLQFQQQQQQEMIQQQQQQQQQQQWLQANPWFQAQPQPWTHNWMSAQAPQPQAWEQQRWDQPAVNRPAQPIFFFNQMPQQQPQFQQQPPPPPPLGNAFQPGLGHQNQFPLPLQNQAPIFPQPFVADNNNNNVNAFNDNTMNQQRPWYMSGDDQKWQQTWENNKVETPLNPHPAAATQWVDNTAVVEPQPMAPQPAPEQFPNIGRDSDGIDGFPREEKFNVPVDVVADVPPQTVAAAPEPAPPVEAPAEAAPVVPTWQHAQPEAAEEPMPASAPMVADSAPVPNAADTDFLPLRVNEEMVGHAQNDADRATDIAGTQGDFPKKFDAPFLQIDDPSTFRQ